MTRSRASAWLLAALAAALLLAGPAAAQWPGIGAPLGLGQPEDTQETAQAEQADPRSAAQSAPEDPPAAPPPPPPEDVAEALERWSSTAQRAKSALESGAASTPVFEVLRETLAEQRAEARRMAEGARAAAEPPRAQLEALGPRPEAGNGAATAESPSVAAERRELRSRLEALEERTRQAELARTRADSLIGRIDALIRARFAEQLLSLGPTPLDPALWLKATEESLATLGRIGEEIQRAWADPVGSRDRRGRLPLLAGALLIGAVLLTWGRRRAVRAIEARLAPGAGRGRRAALGTLATVARLLLPASAVLLIAGALDQSGILGRLGDIWLRHLAGGALLLIAARAIAAAFYAPEAKRLRLSRMADADATHAYRRSLGLGLALLLQVSFVQAGEAMELSAGTLAVLNLAILIPGAISMWALARLVTPPPAAAPAEAGELGEEDGETIEGMERTLAALGAFLMRAAAGASLLLAAAGYYAASQFALYPLAMSLGLVGAGVLIYTLLREAVEAYLEGRTGAPGGLRLLPVLVGFVIVCLSLPALALIWGARRADLAEAWRVIADGVQLGGVSISPAAFLSFIAVFGLVYGLTRLLQTVMAISVLPNTRLDAGGRSAVTTGLGYAGFVFAALAGIGAAGLDLSSIAIVAGALSVGIGFGLQNIVNNFVSGIILLVERPVKVGDWIFVGGDHGIVKRVAVRATQIETFDKTTLFLPNSELISGKVINYTHQNNAGRLIIRVTAAYGSDPREVERVLTGIARAETRILRYPPPLIMFAGFGDNGMLFEMRVILRDVNLIFDIQSDLYFEVEKGLREAGIEIPMAQRAVHFRGGPGSPAPGEAAESAAPPVSAPRPPSRRSEAAEGDPE